MESLHFARRCAEEVDFGADGLAASVSLEIKP